MANSKTIWRGSGSAKLTITQIQTDTAKNSHISSYAFYCDTTELTGNVTNANTYTTSITGDARVNKTKDYTITSYLIYKHKLLLYLLKQILLQLLQLFQLKHNYQMFFH